MPPHHPLSPGAAPPPPKAPPRAQLRRGARFVGQAATDATLVSQSELSCGTLEDLDLTGCDSITPSTIFQVSLGWVRAVGCGGLCFMAAAALLAPQVMRANAHVKTVKATEGMGWSANLCHNAVRSLAELQHLYVDLTARRPPQPPRGPGPPPQPRGGFAPPPSPASPRPPASPAQLDPTGPSPTQPDPTQPAQVRRIDEQLLSLLEHHIVKIRKVTFVAKPDLEDLQEFVVRLPGADFSMLDMSGCQIGPEGIFAMCSALERNFRRGRRPCKPYSPAPGARKAPSAAAGSGRGPAPLLPS